MFKFLILLSALFISFCAAWFSVWGISQLFIGAQTAATIMAISLEVGKLVAVSFVYRFWKDLFRTLKYYMVIGTIVLSLVTSAGVYAYLSVAYAKAAVGYSAGESEVTLLTTQQASLNDVINNNQRRITTLEGYRTQQEARLDSLTGKNGFLTQLSVVRQADTDIRNLQQETRQAIAKRDSLEIEKIQKQNTVRTTSKIGTFWYIAQSLGVSLDTVVKWFVFVIVAVFDPMALALLIAFNFLLKKQSKLPIQSEENKEPSWSLPRISMLKVKGYKEPPPPPPPPPHKIPIVEPPSGPAQPSY